MNSKKTPAIIIKTFPYSETSLIVSMFSAREGKINLLAKGAKRPKNKFGSDLNHITVGELIYTKAKNAELGTLIESYSLFYPAKSITKPYKFFAASYITDILKNFLFLPEDNHTVFKLAYQSLLQIESAHTKNEASLAVLIFEAKIFALSGILPELTNCPNCNSINHTNLIINTKANSIVCNICNKSKFAPKYIISKEMSKIITTIIETETSKIPKALKNSDTDYIHISHTLRNLLDFDLQKQLKSLTFESQI